jgi:hypothetical protein
MGGALDAGQPRAIVAPRPLRNLGSVTRIAGPRRVVAP